MSLHKSKGLTADLVVVLGCIDGLVPSFDDSLPAIEQRKLLEEQRRLFYVAITRATKTLILSSVTAIPRDLAYKIGVRVVGSSPVVNTVTSSFVRELGSSAPDPVRGREFLA